MPNKDTMKIRKLHIDNFKLFQNFTLDFASSGKAQNLIVICGINGSGKTTLFKDFIYHVFKNRVIFKGSYIEIEYEENENTNKFRIDTESLQSGRPLFPKFKNVILYEAGVSDGETAKETIVQFIDTLVYEKQRKN
ncbi:MAG: AAA family ATPase [Desulfobacterales bacterium]|nr:AAA family ATPase [Desulfobacterales bacterium]